MSEEKVNNFDDILSLTQEVLNLVKKSINGLPKKQREYYLPLTLIDNVKELMLEDVRHLSRSYCFEIDSDSVLKRFKKA